jgi:protein TonB
MKRRFAVPAAIALTAHAVLFMGYGKPPAEVVKPTPPVIDDSTKIQVVENTPPAAADSSDDPSDKPKFEGPPGIPELPPTDFPKGPEITQKYVPCTPGDSTSIVPQLSVKNPGDGDGNGLVGVNMLDDTPRTRFQKSPVYPRSLRSAGETGTVWVDFMVDERGYVHDARVVKSTNPGFNDVTLAAVSEWRFEPGKHKGLPVRFRMSLPMVFDITS